MKTWDKIPPENCVAKQESESWIFDVVKNKDRYVKKNNLQ